jgi:transcriptional regulator GlxA family with amidase domain
MREMILYALRWPPSREARDPVAETFFQTMVLLCKEWFKEEMPFSVPRSDNPAICRALEYIRDHLSYATILGASEAAAVSERTLRRLFEQELRCTWRQYLHQSRMVKVMTLLERPGAQMANVTDEVGFESLSAFIKAFREFAGETPSQFQRRARPNSIAE